MNKISFDSINLDCFMQNATELTDNECHEGVISMNNKGVMRFEEKAFKPRTWERNPHIFEGKYINMVRRKDGTMKFNFKNVDTCAKGFNADNYAFRVYTELSDALKYKD